MRFCYMIKKKKDDSYSHILKYTGLFGGVQGLNILMSVVRNKLVAVILGPEGMGLISLFNSSVKLVSDSTNLGISMSAVREISEAYEHGDEEKLCHVISLVRLWSILTALLGMLVCIVFSPLLDRFTFSWGNHTQHFMFLSLAVAMMAISGGELAVLKGTRRLKSLAIISVYGVIGALLTSVPLFYIWGEAAIVPSIILVALLQMLLAICYSFRLFPTFFSMSFSHMKSLLCEGLGMVRLGVAFILAGVLGSGAEFAVRSYLNYTSGLDVVGFYNTGFMMTMTYAGMVFQAMETDYFPRLSAVEGTGFELNSVVNKQIEVSLLLVSPLLAMFILGSPFILRLLFSAKFLPVVDMMKIALLAMYFRAVTLPIEYISLSKGDSVAYLFLEAVYDVMFIAMVILGFRFWALEGTGIALVLLGLVNMVMVLCFMRYRYDYCPSRSVGCYFMVQILLGLLTYWASCLESAALSWGGGGLACLLSLAFSLRVLRSKTELWSRFLHKFKSKLRLK